MYLYSLDDDDEDEDDNIIIVILKRQGEYHSEMGLVLLLSLWKCFFYCHTKRISNRSLLLQMNGWIISTVIREHYTSCLFDISGEGIPRQVRQCITKQPSLANITIVQPVLSYISCSLHRKCTSRETGMNWCYHIHSMEEYTVCNRHTCQSIT